VASWCSVRTKDKGVSPPGASIPSDQVNSRISGEGAEEPNGEPPEGGAAWVEEGEGGAVGGGGGETGTTGTAGVGAVGWREDLPDGGTEGFAGEVADAGGGGADAETVPLGETGGAGFLVR
jgi:hypothetical protein